VAYQQTYACKDADYTVILLRITKASCLVSIHNVQIFSLGKDDNIGYFVSKERGDLDSWLGHFTKGNQTSYYKCYHPSNFVSRLLASERKCAVIEKDSIQMLLIAMDMRKLLTL
jgi:hypothetical protein